MPRLRILIALGLAAVALAGLGAAVALEPFETQQAPEALNLGEMRSVLDEMPRGALTDQEREGVLTLREGAKLSHDVYTAYAAKWGTPVFSSNAFNALTHADAMALLIDRYGLKDPVAGKPDGQFSTDRYRDLYASLMKEGDVSEADALDQSLYLEELGVVYTKGLLGETDKQDLKLVYTTLLRGAALNLRDFARAYRSQTGEAYQPRDLTRAEFQEALRAQPGDLDANSLLLRAGDLGRCGLDDVRPPRRRPRPTTDESPVVARQRDVCSTEVSIDGPASKTIKVGSRQVLLRLLPTAANYMPGPADSNSPALWQGQTLSLFNSWDDETYRSTGNDVENLADPVQISLPRPQRPGNVWLEALWKDPESNILYGWYHLEPSDLPCAPLTAPIIGAATSTDGGTTWQDKGPVLEAAYPYDCDYQNGYFVGGHGDFTVILGPRGQYFYFLFSNYAGPVEEQGVGVARSPYVSRGQPGTLTKLYRGAWNEPGIKGKVSSFWPAAASWKGPHVDAFWGPSVHFNRSIQTYVALLNHTDDDTGTWAQEGIYVTFSDDLVNWTAPVKILNTNNWYPQVLGLSQNTTDSVADRYMRVYIGGISRMIMELLPGG